MLGPGDILGSILGDILGDILGGILGPSRGHSGVILDLGSECLVLQNVSADSDMLDGSWVDCGWAHGGS